MWIPTCRLFQTARVEDLLVNIRIIVLCALEKDFWSSITPEDVALQDCPIQQVTACHKLYSVLQSIHFGENGNNCWSPGQTAKPNATTIGSLATLRCYKKGY
jgi:hypothetical protein